MLNHVRAPRFARTLLFVLKTKEIAIPLAIWSIILGGMITLNIRFIVAHGRFPISEYEVLNWLLGWSA